MSKRNNAGSRRPSGLTWAALVAVAALLGACAGSPPKPATQSQSSKAQQWTAAQKKLYQSAAKARQSGDWQTAAAALAKLTQTHPTPSLWADYGLALQKQHQSAQAENAYRKALAGNAGQAMAANNLALLLRRQGQFDQARSILEKAIQSSPDVASLHYNLGVLYDLYLIKPDKALEQYRAYQKLQDKPDTKVAGWIAQLQREVK